MKVLLFGKNGGYFTSRDGNDIEFYKVSLVLPTTERAGDYNVTGFSSEKVSISKDLFFSLPSASSDYDGGIPCNVEFDHKGNIVALDLV